MLAVCGFVFSVVLLKSGVSCEIKQHSLMECAVVVSCGRATAQLQCNKAKQPDLVIDMRYVQLDGENLAYIQCMER